MDPNESSDDAMSISTDSTDNAMTVSEDSSDGGASSSDTSSNGENTTSDTETRSDDSIADHEVPLNVQPFHYFNRQYFNRRFVFKQGWTPVDNFFIEMTKLLSFNQTYDSFLFSMQGLNASQTEKIFPDNKPSLWKMLGRNRQNIKRYTYCCECKSPLGNSKKPERNCECNQCGPGKLKQPLGFFLHVSVKAQLKQLLARPGIHRSLSYRDTREQPEPNVIKDIYDAKKYKELLQTFLANCNNYSFTIWIDAVQVAKSSKVSATPILLQINELSPHGRKRHIILAGVWVGKDKPVMNDILKPVIEELNDLYENGITWTSADGTQRTSRFITCILSADTEGRWDILNMNRHNGDNGCTFCYATCQRHHGDNGRVDYYYYPPDDPIILRTHEEILRDMEQSYINRQNAQTAEERNRSHVNGVKNYSAMATLRGFDLASGVIVENLHCIFEGVTKRFLDIILKNGGEYRIGTPENITRMNNKLLKIKTPTRLSRRTRTLDDVGFWKGSEFKNFLLFYAPIVFHDILPAAEHQLLMKLCEATFLLHKSSITEAELDTAENLLDEFCTGFQRFGDDQMAYNVHLLKHVVTSVRNWGPLWAYSGFTFEAWNRKVVNNVKSANDRAAQLVDRFLLAKFLEDALEDENLLHEDARSLIRNRLHKLKWEIAPENSTGKYFRGLRLIREVPASENDLRFLQDYQFQIDANTEIAWYRTALIHGARYEIETDKVKESCDFLVHTTTGFYTCKHIISFTDARGTDIAGIIATQLQTQNPIFRSSYIRTYPRPQEGEEEARPVRLHFISFANILSPAISMGYNDDRNVIVPLANCWETD